MVVLISIDGMRPDALAQAATPHIQQLINDGAYTPHARSVMPSITLPCHTSMMRGVDVSRHGITSNMFAPLARPVPSVFDTVKAAGLRTAIYFNWPELRDLAAPGSVDVSVMHHRMGNAGDARVAEEAVASLRQDQIDFAFVYLGATDQAGHDFGWMSEEYIAQVEFADHCVGRVVDAAMSLQRPLNIILLSDHGGHDRSHGTDAPEDMTIPFLMWGYAVESNIAIETPVRLYDVAPTVTELLNIAPAPEWDGRPIREAIRGTAEAALLHPHKTFTLEAWPEN
jgi:predicted AlkP superfamily pyrophosphatase or phosphodiesterase